MTTINNLVDLVGSVEKLKESLVRFLNLQLDESNPSDVILLNYVIENKCNPVEMLEQLNRTAIAQHNTTDHVTDIRNHISPNTKVVEL